MKEALKTCILIYLSENGPTGGEVLRRAIQARYIKPGNTFGRLLFSECMAELVADGHVRDDEKNWRHIFTAL